MGSVLSSRANNNNNNINTADNDSKKIHKLADAIVEEGDASTANLVVDVGSVGSERGQEDVLRLGTSSVSSDTESETESDCEEEMDHRANVLADMEALKAQALAWRHPEFGVSSSIAVTRNFFTRPSVKTSEELVERERILEDVAAMKAAALVWRHPEVPMVKTSAAVTRNYFTRPSANPQESVEEVEERLQIREDAAALKAAAVAWRHPEIGVPPTSINCARNYFTRASAPEQESFEDVEARMQVLNDAVALKEQAIAWRHPEIGVPATSANCARNYFTRASAPEQESLEDVEARMQALSDAVALKEQAIAWRHPEIGVPATSANCARNYFNRGSVYDEHVHTEASAAFYESEDEHHNFDFDLEGEDFVEDLKASLKVTIGGVNQSHPAATAVIKSDEEGDLSRSPSSVMLFGLDTNVAY